MGSFHPNINLTVEMNLGTKYILDVEGVIKASLSERKLITNTLDIQSTKPILM